MKCVRVSVGVAITINVYLKQYNAFLNVKCALPQMCKGENSINWPL